MYYFVNLKGQQQGPVLENDLLKYGVNESTLVWKAGMTQWVKAGEVEELRHLFMPPPVNPMGQPTVGNPSAGRGAYNNAQSIPSQPFVNSNNSNGASSVNSQTTYTGNKYHAPGGRTYQGSSVSMSFLDAIQVCLKQKYTTFEGRASRTEYWFFYLFTLLACIAVSIVFAIMGALFSGGDGDVVIGAVAVGYAIVVLGLVAPSISVTVRRFHDTGRSGWWYWFCAIPYVGWIVVLIFMCFPSEPHDNQYGPVPQV